MSDPWAVIEDGYARSQGTVPALLAMKRDLARDVDAEDVLLAMERARHAALDAGPLQPVTVQLVQFGMCCVLRMADGALVHARAARHLGATKAELLAVARVAWVVAGSPGINVGATTAAQAFEEELS